MVSFVSIMQLQDGLASYQVSELKDSYTAHLINSTSANALPGELKIAKPLQSYQPSDDLLMNKLVLAIRNNEANLDDGP